MAEDQLPSQGSSIYQWAENDFVFPNLPKQMDNFTAALAQIGASSRGTKVVEPAGVVPPPAMPHELDQLVIDPDCPNVAAYLHNRQDAGAKAALEVCKPIFLFISNGLRYEAMKSYYTWVLKMVFCSPEEIQQTIDSIVSGTISEEMREHAIRVQLLRRHFRTIIHKTYTGMRYYVQMQHDAMVAAQAKPGLDARIAFMIAQNTGLSSAVSHEHLLFVFYLVVHFPRQLTMPSANSDPCYICNMTLHLQKKQCVTFSGYTGPESQGPAFGAATVPVDGVESTGLPIGSQMFNCSFCEHCYKIVEALDHIYRFDQLVYNQMRQHLESFLQGQQGEIDLDEFMEDFMGSTHITLTNRLSDAVKTLTIPFECFYQKTPPKEEIDRAVLQINDLFTNPMRQGLQNYQAVAEYFAREFDASPYRHALDSPMYIMPPAIQTKREMRKERAKDEAQSKKKKQHKHHKDTHAETSKMSKKRKQAMDVCEPQAKRPRKQKR